MIETELQARQLHAGISYEVSLRLTPGANGNGALTPGHRNVMWSADAGSLTASGATPERALAALRDLVAERYVEPQP